MFTVRNLSYSRNDAPLFAALSFSLAPGEILHITGANGSGKTTLLYHLIGLITPDAGEILWQKASLTSEFSAQLVFVGHKQGLKSGLTVRENVCLAAQLTNAPDDFNVQNLLIRLGLDGLSNTLCRHLSAGQKQRLALARLLIMPKLLWVLDEPFTAIDQPGVVLLTQLIKEQVEGGGMVILTSHQALSLGAVSVRQLSLSEGYRLA